ncbi:unnamed protein product, partial [Prunus brigantina]
VRKLQLNELEELEMNHMRMQGSTKIEPSSTMTKQFLGRNRYIPPPPYIPPIPFPGRLKKANQDKAFKEIYDILSKVNINLPLLDVVKQIPAYGKFIKHLITHKLNFAPSEEVKLNKNVSALCCKGSFHQN